MGGRLSWRPLSLMGFRRPSPACRPAHKRLYQPTTGNCMRALLCPGRNLCRTHEALRTTPAKALGIADRIVKLSFPGHRKKSTERCSLLGLVALRRSELVALDVADVAETETGLLMTIRRGKVRQTDPYRVLHKRHGRDSVRAMMAGGRAISTRNCAYWIGLAVLKLRD
jgi:hypothetical protein